MEKNGIKEEMQTGVNAILIYINFKIPNVQISRMRVEHEFACVQLQNTLWGRGDIIKETTLEIFNAKRKHIGTLYHKFQKIILNLM